MEMHMKFQMETAMDARELAEDELGLASGGHDRKPETVVIKDKPVFCLAGPDGSLIAVFKDGRVYQRGSGGELLDGKAVHVKLECKC
jgi:hypothetical protein